MNFKLFYINLITLILCECAVFPSSAWAEGETKPDFSPYYSGAFHETSLRVAATTPSGGQYSGWAADIGLRQAFPMELADVRLSYRYDQLEASASPKLQTHGIHAAFGLHPFYFFLLRSDWIGYTLASLYGELGLGGQLAIPEGDDADFAMTWSLGLGADIPLSNADAGSGLRLNLLYRYHSPFGTVTDAEYDLDLHTFFVGLGWRTNGLLF